MTKSQTPTPGEKIRIVRCAQGNPFHEGRIATVLAREPNWTVAEGTLVVSYYTASGAAKESGKETKREHFCNPADWQAPELEFSLPKGHPRSRNNRVESEGEDS
jgi:hypothetical protein